MENETPVKRGRPPKQVAPAVIPPTEVVPPNATDDFDIRSTQLGKEIEAKYNAEWVDIFKRLAYEITVIGLQIEEACIIVGVEYEKLVLLMKQDPLIERLIKTKDLEYKRALLKTVSMKAKTDDKQAQWLLQARYPNEFNPRKGSGGGDGDNSDVLGLAIEFIQKNGDNKPLVTERRMMVVKKGSGVQGERTDVVQEIKDILA